MRLVWPGRQSLTRRFGMLVATLILSTTVLLGLSAASGVYDMARREESSRQRTYLDVVAQQVENRFTVTRRVLISLRSRDAIRSGDPDRVEAAVEAAVEDNIEFIDLILVASREGTVAAYYPSVAGLTEGEISAVAQDAESVFEPELFWRAATIGEGQLWAILPFTYHSGDDGLIFARIDTEPLGLAVAQAVEFRERPTVAILSSSGNVLYAAGDASSLDEGELEFGEMDESGQGAVSSVTASGESYSGYYTTLGGTLGWRMVILEPAEGAIRDTWSALRPAVLTWGAIAMVATVVALVLVRMQVKPLKDLERRANAVARGAYAEPVEVNRSDEIGRLLEAFNSVAARLDRMHDVSQVLARSSERDEVLDGILSAVGHMIGRADVDVLLLSEDSRQFELVRAQGTLSDRRGMTFSRDDSQWLSHAVRGGSTAHYTGDLSEDVLLRYHMGVGTWALAVPLVAGMENLGLIVVVDHHVDGFTDAETEMLRSFAAQSSVALRNARLFAEERRSRNEAEMLLNVSEQISRTGELQEAIDEVLVLQSELLGMGVHRAVIADRDAYGLPPSTGSSSEDRLLESWSSLFGGDDAGLAEKARFIHRASADKGIAAFMDSMGVESMVVTPLVIGSSLVGLLIAGTAETGLYPTPRQLRVAEVIGDQLSLALQNEMLFEQARARADNLETVFRISQAVSSSLQSKVVLNRVLDVVQKIFSADAVILMTYDSERRALVVPMARGSLHRDMLEAEVAPGEDIPGRVFASKQSELYDTLVGVDTRLAQVALEQDLDSLLVVPLLARGRSIGVLCVLATIRSAFDDDDMELLRTFASQASLAIDNARMFSREHHVATVLQESILPSRLPRVMGVDSSSIYLPAGTEADIGGDYYDLFKAPDGRLVMAIGDVCGKGVAAATKTSMIKYSIRGMVVAGLEPQDILSEINGMLLEQSDPTNIVTLWVGLLDVTDGRLVYANGGHPPGLLLQPSDGRIERLATTGALLGAVEDAEYALSEVVVEPDGTVLLYTDGVTEARNKTRFFGEGRVRRALKKGDSAAVVSQRLLADVQRFSGGELRDDAAILTVRRVWPDDRDLFRRNEQG